MSIRNEHNLYDNMRQDLRQDQVGRLKQGRSPTQGVSNNTKYPRQYRGDSLRSPKRKDAIRQTRYPENTGQYPENQIQKYSEGRRSQENPSLEGIGGDKPADPETQNPLKIILNQIVSFRRGEDKVEAANNRGADVKKENNIVEFQRMAEKKPSEAEEELNNLRVASLNDLERALAGQNF